MGVGIFNDVQHTMVVLELGQACKPHKRKLGHRLVWELDGIPLLALDDILHGELCGSFAQVPGYILASGYFGKPRRIVILCLTETICDEGIQKVITCLGTLVHSCLGTFWQASRGTLWQACLGTLNMR